MSPDFLKSDVAGALGVDPEARDVQANIMSMAAEKIKEMYGRPSQSAKPNAPRLLADAGRRPAHAEDQAAVGREVGPRPRSAHGRGRPGRCHQRTGMSGAGALTVVRTGKDASGRKVKQMSDGSIQYGE